MTIDVIPDEKYFLTAKQMIDSAGVEIFVSQYAISSRTTKSNTKVVQIVEALCEAVDRGISVNVFLSYLGKPVKVNAENQAVARKLMSRGVRVRYLSGRRCVHAKILLIDGRSVLLGSHNWKQSAFERNFELSIFTDEPRAVREILNILIGLLPRALDFPG